MEFTGMGILGESMLMKVQLSPPSTRNHFFERLASRVSGPLRAKSVSEDPVGVGQEWAHRGGQRAPL